MQLSFFFSFACFVHDLPGIDIVPGGVAHGRAEEGCVCVCVCVWFDSYSGDDRGFQRPHFFAGQKIDGRWLLKDFFLWPN